MLKRKLIYYKSVLKAMMATQMTNKYNVPEVTLFFVIHITWLHLEQNQPCSGPIEERIKEHLVKLLSSWYSMHSFLDSINVHFIPLTLLPNWTLTAFTFNVLYSLLADFIFSSTRKVFFNRNYLKSILVCKYFHIYRHFFLAGTETFMSDNI